MEYVDAGSVSDAVPVERVPVVNLSATCVADVTLEEHCMTSQCAIDSALCRACRHSA